MLGRLSLAAIDFRSLIIMSAFGFMIFMLLALAAIITYLKKWRYMWDEWFTSVDHKKIGIMYIFVALVMGVRGFIDSVMMRTQIAASYGPEHGFLLAEHFNQVFTGHGVIMIFLMAMPLLIGLMNIAMPLQIGARDVAFPAMNLISFWLFFAAVALMNISLGIGEFAKTGWVAYPPLSELEFSPYVGVDYYIWLLQIAGIGTLLTGINFLVTILKMRAPGMTFMKMPLFTWTTLAASILIIGAFPILTVNLSLLALDRYLGMHFFTNDGGGNMMLYVNWFWAWGHPEVYILILPAFGIFSEIFATFSNKRLFGYNTMIYSILAIIVISFMVWLHHFFIMGAGGTVNAIFGIMTMIIAVPTGVKIFNWIFTMYRGRLRFDTPLLWSIAFLLTFVLGGMAGVMLAMPPADFVLHNSQFLIAHFHNVIISGTVFGALAGYIYWFPKAWGFKLNETLGKLGFWVFVTGVTVTFTPLYVLGFMGMTRRLYHYDNPAWQKPIWLAGLGVAITAVALVIFITQLVVSFLQREKNRDVTGDPWNGRTLEWSTTSPAPIYNFAIIPSVSSRDDFWDKKQQHKVQKIHKQYHDILMPKNTGVGFWIGIFCVVLGFGMVWRIWWLACIGAAVVFIALVQHLLNDDTHYRITADEVREIEGGNAHV